MPVAIVGVLLLVLGWELDTAIVCPSVKRLLMPSWVPFSGGWCFLLLAAFSAALDTVGPRG